MVLQWSHDIYTTVPASADFVAESLRSSSYSKIVVSTNGISKLYISIFEMGEKKQLILITI